MRVNRKKIKNAILWTITGLAIITLFFCASFDPEYSQDVWKMYPVMGGCIGWLLLFCYINGLM